MNTYSNVYGARGPHQVANIAISWAQLLACTSTSIFEDVTTLLPHLAPMIWIPSIWRHLGNLEAHIFLATTHVVPLQRKHDLHHMDFFIWKSLPRDLCRLNTCHLFLGVTLLSNITCPCGRYIYQDSIIGRKDVIPSSRMLYLYQDSPNSASWKLWAKALAPLLHPRTLSLRQPLTRWIVTGGESIRKWPVFIHTNHSGVYIPNNADFSVHPLSHRTVHYNISYITSHLPSCAIPAEFADHYHRTLLLFVSHVTIHATSTCSRLWIITENYAPLGVCSLTQSDTNWEPIY